MQIDKNAILELLRERGDQQTADQAAQELPDQVDTDQHAGLLDRFGLDPNELLSRFSGGLPGT
jgi:uncharacterized protein YidB (DUF937 family)